MNCPKCRSEIPNTNINIQTDVAQCSDCGNIFKISGIIPDIHSNFDLNDAPKGAWHHYDFDKTTIGATTRTPIAFFLVPFMLVWSGMSLGGIYGPQIISGEFDLTKSLFGIPFLIGSLIFWCVTLMAIFGKIELTFDKQGGKIFTGIGKTGLTKHFIWKDVSKIEEKISNIRYPGNQGGLIVFEGKKRLSFGLGLNEERKYYILQALKNIHSKMKN